jgi:ankyrin repeat protein
MASLELIALHAAYTCLQEATPEELALVQQLQLHTTFSNEGWTALHYAAATLKAKLVQQLLDLGASPAAGAPADNVTGLTPLHLACMGRVKSQQQLEALLKAEEDLFWDLQVILSCCNLVLGYIG